MALYHFTFIGAATITLDTAATCSEDDGTVEVCAVINGLPAEGLENDVTVDLDVVDGNAGAMLIVTSPINNMTLFDFQLLEKILRLFLPLHWLSTVAKTPVMETECVFR